MEKRIFVALLTVCGLVISFMSFAQDDELNRRLVIWNIAAPLCSSGGSTFPTKQLDNPAQPCDDGDMTLFNGLLCSAGDDRGCKAVADSQDSVTGLWFRSPRIRALGANDRGNADFSPDMALGLQLYFIKTRDVVRAQKWLKWIDDNTPCKVMFIVCLVKTPKFCRQDDCVIRPGDYAILSNTVSFLQKNAGLQELPSGALRGNLGTFGGMANTFEYVASQVNDSGFPQHLSGTAILLLRQTVGDNLQLRDAAKTLQAKNPGNAFFSFLAEGATVKVKTEVLSRCTDKPQELKHPKYQWQWERANEDKAWEQSCLWDCIFMKYIVSGV
jgi:hypothetical protein